MLVLSREKNESIMIGTNIKVTVADIRGNKVRLAFDAPKEIPIFRQELFDAIEEEKKSQGDQP